MANGTVSYRGQELTRGDMGPSNDTFEYFEDFIGCLELRSVAVGVDAASVSQYPGTLVSTVGTDATITAVANGATSGGSISFDAASTTLEALSIPNCSIDVDAGDWFIEARVSVETLGAVVFAFGLQENVSFTASLAQTVGAAGDDVVMMFYDSGSTTAGLLESSVTKNTDHTANANAAAGMTGAQLVAGTFHRLAIRHDKGLGKVYFYFDGSLVDEVANTNMSDQILHPFIGSGGSALASIVVDYVYVLADR
tara:strand:- start:3541 stop:4299 length:759 start_codon:yes stop_codon:yes gene_type:complete